MQKRTAAQGANESANNALQSRQVAIYRPGLFAKITAAAFSIFGPPVPAASIAFAPFATAGIAPESCHFAFAAKVSANGDLSPKMANVSCGGKALAGNFRRQSGVNLRRIFA